MSLITETLSNYKNKNNVVTPSIDITSSQLVLHRSDDSEDDNDEYNSNVTQSLDDLTAANAANIIPAEINVENSKDVIIGPVTQFHGNVTIYQNGNGPQSIDYYGNDNSRGNGGQNAHKLVKSESSASDSSQLNSSSLFKSKHARFIVISLFLILCGVVIIVCVMFLPNKDETKESTTTISNEVKPSSLSPTLSSSGSTWGKIFPKERWGGYPALNFTRPLAHPTPMVIISHTATPFCDTFEVCSRMLINIQAEHVSTGSPDIGYNFLIGGDGNVYVGRGWDIRNFHGDDSLGVCFIGNYVGYDHLNRKMIETTQKLLKQGEEMGKLDKDYVLVAHNQTYATLSPGANVYREIKNWPHFNPEVSNNFLD